MCVHNVYIDCSVNENDLSHRMQMISRIGDPSLAFTLYFPIVVGINFRSGIRFLGAAILCEWMNQVLKWYKSWFYREEISTPSIYQM